MSNQSLDFLRNRLVREGISPRYARRLVAELAEHLHEATLELRRRGVADADALTLARRRIGTDDAIVQQVLATHRFHSFGRRWPVLAFVLAPVLAFPALVIALVMMIGLLVGLALAFERLPHDEWSYPFVYGIVGMFPLALIAIAAATFLYGRSRGCSMLWPLAGITLLAILSSFLDLNVGPAGATPFGSVAATVGHRWVLPLFPLGTFAILWFSRRRSAVAA